MLSLVNTFSTLSFPFSLSGKGASQPVSLAPDLQPPIIYSTLAGSQKNRTGAEKENTEHTTGAEQKINRTESKDVQANIKEWKFITILN